MTLCFAEDEPHSREPVVTAVISSSRHLLRRSDMSAIGGEAEVVRKP
jgi:hypothetical protein